MEKEQVKYIESLPLSQVSEIKKDDLCKGCGLWPCYATAPECFRYEDEA